MVIKERNYASFVEKKTKEAEDEAELRREAVSWESAQVRERQLELEKLKAESTPVTRDVTLLDKSH